MIKLIDVTKRFQELKALDNISLSFTKGEVVVIKGKSGSGKSTLLSLISALSKPTSGKIIIDDTDITALSEFHSARFRLENIGFIFQRYNLLEHFSVAENISAPLIPLALRDEIIEQKIDTLLEQLELSSKKTTIVKKLSGGEQQRVAIARSLINDPKIILADEPTANLDKTLSLKFINYLEQLKAKERTIIIATHDPLFFDLDFVDRVLTMEGGKCF